MKCPTPPPGVGWGFAKFRVSKEPPLGPNLEAKDAPLGGRVISKPVYSNGKSPTPGDGEFGKRGLIHHPTPGGGWGISLIRAYLTKCVRMQSMHACIHYNMLRFRFTTSDPLRSRPTGFEA